MKYPIDQRAAAIIRDAEDDGQLVVLLNVLEAFQDVNRGFEQVYSDIESKILEFFNLYVNKSELLTQAVLKNFLTELLPEVSSAVVDHHEFDWPRDLIIEAIR